MGFPSAYFLSKTFTNVCNALSACDLLENISPFRYLFKPRKEIESQTLYVGEGIDAIIVITLYRPVVVVLPTYRPHS